MADLFVSWQDYIDLNEQLVLKVADSGWKFDSLLCLARGGMRPGDIFSRVYSKPLSVLSTSSYRAMSGTVQGELNISSCITGTEALKGKVLLVDDMVDSGITLEKVVKHLKSDFPEITENPYRCALVEGTLHLPAGLFRLLPRREPLDPPAVRGL